MSKSIHADHSQQFLLPPALEDWVPADHPARFLRDFVGHLDLEMLGFVESPGLEGRPHYALELLLTVWLYGYLEKIRSPRKLEHACRTHMPLLWLTGMHTPDHNTLWRFWRDHKVALRGVFRQTVLVARQMGLVGLVVHALDGTKITVRASRRSAIHKQELETLHEEITASIAAMETTLASTSGEAAPDALPQSLQDAHARNAAIELALASLAEQGQEHLQPDEPDARLMKNDGRLQWSYNAQATVDASDGILVAQEVVNDANDNAQLLPMLEQAREHTGEAAQTTLADNGYRNTEQHLLAHNQGHNVVLPPHGRERDESNPYDKSQFHYDEQRDCYVCPQRQTLCYSTTRKPVGNRPPVRVYQCRCSKTCPTAAQCTRNKNGRTINRHKYHAFREQQERIRQAPEIRALIQRRKAIIEPVFAWIKEANAFRRWTSFGLDNAKTQWAMLCTTINLRKLYRYWKTTQYPAPAPTKIQTNLRKTAHFINTITIHERERIRKTTLNATHTKSYIAANGF